MSFKSIAEIKRANKEAGFYFFDRKTMQHWKSKVLPTVYAGKYFITSEDFGSGRVFQVREANDRGSVRTVTSEHLPSKEAAVAYVKRLLGSSALTLKDRGRGRISLTIRDGVVVGAMGSEPGRYMGLTVEQAKHVARYGGSGTSQEPALIRAARATGKLVTSHVGDSGHASVKGKSSYPFIAYWHDGKVWRNEWTADPERWLGRARARGAHRWAIDLAHEYDGSLMPPSRLTKHDISAPWMAFVEAFGEPKHSMALKALSEGANR